MSSRFLLTPDDNVLMDTSGSNFLLLLNSVSLSSPVVHVLSKLPVYLKVDHRPYVFTPQIKH